MAIVLVVETGAGVPEANTLVSLEYANAYFSNHPFYADSWEEIEEEQRKRLLMLASRIIGSLFVWPTLGFMTPEGVYSLTYIPKDLLDAVCEQAYWLSTPQGNPDTPDDAAGLDELKVDVIQLKFTGSTARRAVPVAVTRLLRGLGLLQNSGRVRRVQVGLA